MKTITKELIETLRQEMVADFTRTVIKMELSEDLIADYADSIRFENSPNYIVVKTKSPRGLAFCRIAGLIQKVDNEHSKAGTMYARGKNKWMPDFSNSSGNIFNEADLKSVSWAGFGTIS